MTARLPKYWVVKWRTKYYGAVSNIEIFESWVDSPSLAIKFSNPNQINKDVFWDQCKIVPVYEVCKYG